MFPLPNSAQRLDKPLSVKRSSKVPLKPGHSLMDWIQLAKSGADLRQTGSKLLSVSMEELQLHNKPHDAWLAIRGFVYNVTKYNDYHPGGSEELMKGAGKDATKMFDEVHRWVNFESILKACLVGKLVSSNISTSKQTKNSLGLPSQTNLKLQNISLSTSYKAESSTDTPLPIIISEAGTSLSSSGDFKTTWRQSSDEITVICATNPASIGKRSVVCDIDKTGHLFQADLFFENEATTLEVIFSEQVHTSITLNVRKPHANLEFTLKKFHPELKWNSLGSYTQNHCRIVPIHLFKPRYRLCQLISRSSVTHDTLLYHFRLPTSCHMHVPVGHHVYLQVDVDGVLISKPYTVIIPDICTENAEDTVDEHNFYLMIKLYEDGIFTPNIRDLGIADQIQVSTHEGRFSLDAVTSYRKILLVCAGTGFTPMARILHFCIYKTDKTVHLAFYNKQSRDILWKNELNALCYNFPDRFSVEHILSRPDSNWNGKSGHVTLQHLKGMIGLLSDPVFVLVCGPTPFTDLVLKFLSDLKIASSDIFAFTS